MYGITENSIREAHIIEKTSPINCEWFTCPKITASEFAETVTSDSSLDLEKLYTEIDEQCQALSPLNNENEIVITSEYLKCFVRKKTKTDYDLSDRIEHLSVMLYLVSVNQTVRVQMKKATICVHEIDI